MWQNLKGGNRWYLFSDNFYSHTEAKCSPQGYMILKFFSQIRISFVTKELCSYTECQTLTSDSINISKLSYNAKKVKKVSAHFRTHYWLQFLVETRGSHNDLRSCLVALERLLLLRNTLLLPPAQILWSSYQINSENRGACSVTWWNGSDRVEGLYKIGQTLWRRFSHTRCPDDEFLWHDMNVLECKLSKLGLPVTSICCKAAGAPCSQIYWNLF
jgi:hypothetical protein